MGDAPYEPEATSDVEAANAQADQAAPPGVPRWVKVSGIIAIVLGVLIVVALLSGAFGEHGPGRHRPGNDGGGTTPAGEHTPPAGGHTPPSGGHG